MNELVERLTKEQPVENARPEKTAKELKECIDRDYVHVIFKKTDTKVGIRLNRRDCKFEGVNFEEAKGNLHLVGGLILNYDKVRCIADIDLATCEGNGHLEPVGDEEYDQIMGRTEEYGLNLNNFDPALSLRILQVISLVRGNEDITVSANPR